MKKIKASCIAVICTATLLMTACSHSGDSTSSYASTATAAPKVTLPAESGEDSIEAVEDVGGETSSITPLMWEVVSPDGTKITLMGSMHALKDEVYPLPDRIMEAYDNAEIVAVECDISTVTSNFAVQVKQLENMYYDDGTTLKDHLSEEVYSNLSDYISACGEDIESYDNFQLWALSSQMESLALAQTDLSSGYGFDINILQMAHDDGKEIYEVESVEFQADLLLNIPEETYQTLLSSYSAETKDALCQEYEDTYEAWIEGDYDFFVNSNSSDSYEEQAEQSGTPLDEEEIQIIEDYNNVLIYQRNVGMAQAVEELLTGDKDVFYVVGEAHFVGDGGIIDLLEKDGYTVTRVEYN